jgi:hypothetical protein
MFYMALGKTPGLLTLAKERRWWWTPRFFRSIGSVARYNLTYVDTTFRSRIRQKSDAFHVGHVSHGVG